ncbi:MAG: hypothetical protein IJY66_03145 [Clostridia bacterium]|nr:hypothetical protein [Clostridia bacterium]
MVYASNRYDREVLRVPQNYAGNAFAPPRAQPQEPVRTLPPVPASEVGEESMPIETPMPTEVPPAPEEKKQPMAEIASPQESREDAREWLTRLGIGQEELLLLGLLLLMRGEQSEDITWLLLLLLALR